MKDRIQRIIDDKKLSPSRFADEVGLNRPAVSHILNGRNNPGLDALQRILARYKDINAAWLISGVGPMYNGNQRESFIPSLFDENAENPTDSSDHSEYHKEMEVKPAMNVDKTDDNQIIISKNATIVKVKKIAVFYSDNTYEEFIPAPK
ncbi:MAG: helix-turn-helix transcriptional regulator [Paludibacter sp.]|nr:helix-turn-helix transcriptional regulator [Paludibacter sp.]